MTAMALGIEIPSSFRFAFGVLPKPSSHPMLFIIAVAPKSCRSAVLVGKFSRVRPEDPWFPKHRSDE
jgi:hypothetical protein